MAEMTETAEIKWSTLPLFKKIQIQGSAMTKAHHKYLDKIRIKDVVQSIEPTLRVARLVKTFTKLEDFIQTDIHPHHILKAHRGSGSVLDLAHTTLNKAHESMKSWSVELLRKGIPPEFLIEEKINDAVLGRTGSAVDYKFFCFHGEPRFFLRRYKNNRHFYYPDWTPIKHEGSVHIPQIDISSMIEAVRKLSAPFPFVRIDLYHGNDGIYFGEYTFHVCQGKQEFNMETELRFGAFWC